MSGAAIVLMIPTGWYTRLLPMLVSFAIGALLGAAFLALLPHALTAGVEAHAISGTVLLGILLFFFLEKMVLWRHCHHDHCEAHAVDLVEAKEKAAGKLILIGDGIHNFVDGVLIAAAFLTDTHLGVVTALAVITHEIPQELGDFAILLQGGLSRGRAFFYNILSALTSVFGGILAYFFLSSVQGVTPFLLALAAASFIYIAVADLIPGLHRRLEIKETIQQVILIMSGVAVIYSVHSTLH